MEQRGFRLGQRPLELLTEEQVHDIHRATLHVLWETGIRVESEWAVDFLAKSGCRVDRESCRVHFPADLVEGCLHQAPERFPVRARAAKDDLVFGGDWLHFSHSSGMQTIDLETVEPRTPTRAEYIDCIRILDALPTIACLGAYPYFGYEGVAPVMAIPEGVALALRYSSKHQTAGASQGCEIFSIQMAQAVGAEISTVAASSAPLTWGPDAIMVARRMVEAGLPIVTVDGCVMGGTGPATVAGSVVVSNAEHLAMITLTQLLRPGQRVMVGHFASSMNMVTGSPAFGQIEASLSNAIWNQMWRHYGVPRSNGSPGYVNAKRIDYQAGYEKGMAGLLSALSGANHLLLHFGVAAEITAHPVQAVLDDDLAGAIGRFIAGEEVSPETIAVELIEQVGPIPGSYLDTAHTRKWWRREQYVPKAADRLTYPEWLARGKVGALDYARRRVEEILASCQPEPLAPGQEEDLERILEEARRYYRAKALM
ncbi:MAG: trimethylamine methyltransferase family protein [Anaerolineae bacterium]|nr:trimethylamine methyltransferase family protein [Anaerolineae bacterium]